MRARFIRLKENAFVSEQGGFLPVNIEADEKRLSGKGKENGAENYPREQASRPDAVESGITADISATVEQTRGALSRHFVAFYERLLNILGVVEPKALINTINRIPTTTKARLLAVLDRFRNECVILEREWRNAQREYEKFQKDNGLTQDAEYPALRSSIRWFVTIFLVEAVLNAALLWDFIGAPSAVGQFLLITAVNVLFGASLVGLLWRYKNHVSRRARRLAWMCAPASLLVLAFNVGVGHYRDAVVAAQTQWENLASRADSDDAAYFAPDFVDYTQKAMQNLIESPIGIDSILSVLLILVGLGFFSFAAYKWYSMLDPYPGYRKRDLARKEKHKNYKRMVETTHDKIDRLVEDASERIDDEYTKLMNMRELHSDLSNRAKALQSAYARWVGALAERQNHLIRLYRDQNQRARNEPSPKYFEDDARQIAGNLAEPPDFAPPAAVSEVDTVVSAVEAAQEEMQKISATILREFKKLADMQPNDDDE